MNGKKELTDKELEKIIGGKEINRESSVLCDCGSRVKIIDGYGVIPGCGHVYDLRR